MLFIQVKSCSCLSVGKSLRSFLVCSFTSLASRLRDLHSGIWVQAVKQRHCPLGCNLQLPSLQPDYLAWQPLFMLRIMGRHNNGSSLLPARQLSPLPGLGRSPCPHWPKVHPAAEASGRWPVPSPLPPVALLPLKVHYSFASGIPPNPTVARTSATVSLALSPQMPRTDKPKATLS